MTEIQEILRVPSAGWGRRDARPHSMLHPSRILSDPKLKLIPVVVLISSREESDMVASYQLGVNAYMVKPVDFHELVNAINELGIFWAIINEPPLGSVGKAR